MNGHKRVAGNISPRTDKGTRGKKEPYHKRGDSQQKEAGTNAQSGRLSEQGGAAADGGV